MRSVEDFVRVKRLVAIGLNDYEIARRSGIPRATVQRYRTREVAPRGARPRHPRTSVENWRPPDPRAYCYLLGLYLGDGCIYEPKRGNPRLGITLDAKYPGVIGEAARALAKTVPGTNVCRTRRTGAVVVLASHEAWTSAFPQHGPGRKHERRIELEGWQSSLTHAHPEALLRGLIHSDGSRAINSFSMKLLHGRVGHYSYVRYFFTNRSADIRRIFCEHCELVGVRWTQSNHQNISVSHRDSVAILDSFIGPKR